MKYSEAKEILEKQKEAEATAKQFEKLAKAHEQFGFKNRKEFIQALQEVEGERKGGRARGTRRGGKRSAPKGGRAGRGARGLSQEVIDKIKGLKAEGKTNAEISRLTKVSPLTVAKYVKGVKSAKTKPAAKKAPAAKSSKRGAGRGRSVPTATINRIKSMKAEGKSNAAISRATKVSPITVAKYLKGAGGNGSSQKSEAAS